MNENKIINFRCYCPDTNKMYMPTHITFCCVYSYCYDPEDDCDRRLDNKYVMRSVGLFDCDYISVC